MGPLLPPQTHLGGPRTQNGKAKVTASCPVPRWRQISELGATWNMENMRATCTVPGLTPSAMLSRRARCACWTSTLRYISVSLLPQPQGPHFSQAPSHLLHRTPQMVLVPGQVPSPSLPCHLAFTQGSCPRTSSSTLSLSLASVTTLPCMWHPGNSWHCLPGPAGSEGAENSRVCPLRGVYRGP